MATTFSNPTDTRATEVPAQQPGITTPAAFDVQFRSGDTRQFCSEGEIREAILSGEIPRNAHIRKIDAPVGEKLLTVETWAKANPAVRALYTPVWSMTMKGALVGVLTVAALKALDTLIGLLAVNPAAAIVWLLLVVGMVSPKWKVQLLAAAVFLGFQARVNFMFLWGAWIGVLAFAAVFGTSAGMAIGTIIGFLRGDRLPKAPDADREGRKPLIFGLAIPLATFVAAVMLYVHLLMPAALKLLSHR